MMAVPKMFKMSVPILLAIGIIGVGPGLPANGRGIESFDDPTDIVPAMAKTTSDEERFQTLLKEYSIRREAYFEAYDQAKTDEEKREVREKLFPPDAEYAKRFLTLAREEPTAPAVQEALSWTIQLGGHGPEAEAAIELLRRDHAGSPRMAEFCRGLSPSPHPNAEVLLREVLEKNPDRAARGQACLALAGLLDVWAGSLRRRMQDPKLAEAIEGFYGKERLDRLAKRNPQAMFTEAEALFERVASQYGDVPSSPAFPDDGRTIGEEAESWLAERRELAIGRPAPEIAGRDIAGKPLKLSDYRGKVVVVIFWASWCRPCMDMVQHERELANRMEGRPFALLGVNCDYSEDEARTVIVREKITWPNWYDGGDRRGSPAERYRVRGLPQVYVLGPDGIIRGKDIRGEALDKAVEALLAEFPGPK